MPKLSVQISDRLEQQVIDRTDYPNKRKSDVVRDALELYVSMENTDEVIHESKSK